MSDVRPFSLRHTMLVSRLQKVGTPLDLEQALTRPRGPLWSALLGQSSLAEGPVCTFVLQESKGAETLEGFSQARLRPGGDQADIIFLAPALGNGDEREEVWRRLLDGMIGSLAAQGVRKIFCRLSDELEAAHLFLDAGFSLYTREDVFCLDRVPVKRTRPALLEQAREEDQWGIAKLCATCTPRLVRALEGMGNPSDISGFGVASGWEHQYVWNDSGRTAGYVRLTSGPRGHWIQLMIHPDESARAEEMIRDALSRLPRDGERRACCSVRAYQAHLRAPLQDVGFRFLTSQSVLVRITAVPVAAARARKAAKVETRAEVRTPTATPTITKCA